MTRFPPDRCQSSLPCRTSCHVDIEFIKRRLRTHGGLGDVSYFRARPDLAPILNQSPLQLGARLTLAPIIIKYQIHNEKLERRNANKFERCKFAQRPASTKWSERRGPSTVVVCVWSRSRSQYFTGNRDFSSLLKILFPRFVWSFPNVLKREPPQSALENEKRHSKTVELELLSRNNCCEHSFSSIFEHKNSKIFPTLCAQIRKIRSLLYLIE
uniref:Uncharacterized protein n=1 Tax=Romanomermis culicivorax TaxID=13658 RepID=A0A915HMQ5_ROMCU